MIDLTAPYLRQALLLPDHRFPCGSLWWLMIHRRKSKASGFRAHTAHHVGYTQAAAAFILPGPSPWPVSDRAPGFTVCFPPMHGLWLKPFPVPESPPALATWPSLMASFLLLFCLAPFYNIRSHVGSRPTDPLPENPSHLASFTLFSSIPSQLTLWYLVSS